jgi:serine/threonine protein kinase
MEVVEYLKRDILRGLYQKWYDTPGKGGQIEFKDDVVIKKHFFRADYDSEKKWLNHFRGVDGFPQMISACDDTMSVTMPWCGEAMTRESNIPPEIKSQFDAIDKTLHGMGLFHNDIKPANICLKDGIVTLIDLTHVRPYKIYPLRNTFDVFG